MHLRLDAGFLEHIAEAFLGQRLALATADVGKLAGRPRIERRFQHRQYRDGDGDGLAAFFGSECANTIAHMLAANYYRIAPPQPGVEQDVDPYALLRANGPVLLVLINLILGPDREARALSEPLRTAKHLAGHSMIQPPLNAPVPSLGKEQAS